MIPSPTMRLSAILLLVAFCFLDHHVNAQSVTADTAFIDHLYLKSKPFWNKSDSAFYYLNQIEDLSRKINYQRGIAYALYGYGVNEHVMYKQFENFTKSLEIFEREHDQQGIGLNLVKIGYIYERIGQIEKALEYYKQALVVKKTVDDFGGIALVLISIGHYYQYKGEFEEALKYFEESLIYRLKEGTPQGVGFAQVNMGDALFSLNRIERALAMADSAIKNFTLSSNQNGQVWALYLKGKSLKKLGKQAEAENAFQNITHYKENRNTDFSLLAKKELIEMHSKRSDFQKAFQLQSEYLVAKDTLAKRDYRAETQRLVNEYEFKVEEQKAQREREIQEQRIARRNNLENLSIAIIVLLIFVVLFSGRKKLSSKIVNISLLIGLLLFFEFLLILTDSSVDKITQGEPILKLLANVFLALLILPGHQFLEQYSRKKLIQQDVT